MRWATPIPLSLPLSSSQRSHRSFFSSLLSRDLSLSSQILSLLHTLPSSHSLSSALDLLSPLLTPHLISHLLSLSPPFPQSFRLFLWASAHKRLRSWTSFDLILSSLRSNPTNLSSSIDFIHDFKNSGLSISPLAFAVLIKAHSDSGNPEKALELFSSMSEFDSKPNTFTYNSVLNVLVKKDAIFLAVAMYYQMAKIDCRPNRATFGILINGLCNAGLIGDAQKLFDEMARSGIAPNAMIYTIIISAFCVRGRIDEAEKLFELMRKKECERDEIVFNVMLSGYCRLGRVDEAFEKLKVFKEIEEGFVLGLSGYCSLIDGLFKAKRPEEACRLYEELLEKNIEPDCILYTTMMRGYLKAGRVEGAFAFMREMADRNIVPDVYCYNTLIKGLCDAGCLDQARFLMQEFSRHDLYPNLVTYNIMICGLCKEGLVVEAEQIFNEMGKLGCGPTVYTYNSLITGLCKAGMLVEARDLFNKMKIKPSLALRLSQGIGPVRDTGILRKMVEQLCEAGLVVKAYKLFRDIIDVVLPDDVTYNVLMNGFFKIGKPDEALNLFKELHFTGYSPWDEVTLGTLIDGLLKTNREVDEWMVYQHILKHGHCPSPSICNTLMRSMCQKRRVPQAISLWLTHIAQWNTNTEEVETIKVVKNFFEQGYLKETVKGLIEMDRKSGSINSSPYTIWLIGFCQAHKVDEALKIFTILTESDIEVTPASCVKLIHSLCWEGKLGLAVDIMLYVLRQGFTLDQPVGNRLLKKLCIGNKIKEAHELVWKMSLAGYDMDVYLRASTKRLLYNKK